jgi:hypothetical protein
MTEVLPPLQEAYGDQLQIVEIDVSISEGADLYLATIDYFDIPRERQGVPTLVVGDVVLVGSREIPERLPDMIEQGLDDGGVDLPAIPGLESPATE